MSSRSADDELVVALAALPAYEVPLLPVYEALGPERPLTLSSIRDHSRLFQDCAPTYRRFTSFRSPTGRRNCTNMGDEFVDLYPDHRLLVTWCPSVWWTAYAR